MGEMKILKKNLFITFFVIIILIFCSGALGWFLTQKIENSNKIINTIHQLKESELQLRGEEKDLLLRGYSVQRYLRWQNAKENFHRNLGMLIGMQALNSNEINTIKTDHSELSDTYNKFFDKIRASTLNKNEIDAYDIKFKEIGRRTLDNINDILSRELEVSTTTDSQADILLAIFIVVFAATAGFLIVNVIRHV